MLKLKTKPNSKNVTIASFNMKRQQEYDVISFEDEIVDYEKEKLEFM